MKRYLLLFIAILGLVASVSAGWSLDFQNPSDFTEHITSGGAAWYQNNSGGNNYIVDTAEYDFYIVNADPLVMTYSAITMEGGAISTDCYRQVTLYDSAHGLIQQFGVPQNAALGHCSLKHRMELKVEGNVPKLYAGGTLAATGSALTGPNPSFIQWGGHGGQNLIMDDAVWGDSEPKYIFGMPEAGYFLMKDILNPANSGLFRVNQTNPNGTPVSISASIMTSTFGKPGLYNETITFSSPTGGTPMQVDSGANMHGIIYWNISQLFTSTSAAYGLYQTGINPQTNSSGFATSDWIPYIGSGAHIEFDKNSYAIGETATLSVLISDTYYDAIEDPHVVIMDIYGNEINDDTSITFTELVNHDWQGISEFTWTDDLDEGVYYGLIYATTTVDDVEVLMDYDTADLTSNLIISGYVFDAVNATVISGALVNVTQGVTTDALTTASDGNYSTTSQFVANAPTTIVASKTGYETYQHVFTPLQAGELQIYITLMLNSLDHSGYAVGGLARTPPYNRTIGSASIEIQNGSDYNLTTTNSVGYYFKDNLTASKQYNVSGSKSGFSNSSIYSITTTNNWTRQDVMMDQIYTLTLNIKDADTLNGIPNANIQTSRGDNTTADVFGELTLTMNYTALVVQAGAEGYYSRTITYVVDRDREETIYLTQIGETVTPQQPIQQVYPHYVTIHLKEGWGTALAGVAVTAQGVSTSTGSWDSIVALLGLPLDEVPINSTIMSQTTDDLGRVTFYMIPTGKYNLTFTKAGYTISSMVLVPQDDNYIVWATGTPSYYEHGVNELEAINVSIMSVAVNDSYNYLNLTYTDSTGHTTGGYIDVLQKNDTPGGAATLLKRWYVPAGSPNSFTNSTGVTHVQQVSGQVSTNITNTEFGNIKRSYPFQMNSVPISFLGFGDNIKLLVALGMMLFTAMLAGATHARQVMVVVAFEGVIFYTFGWFEALVQRGVTDFNIWMGLALLFFVAVLMNMETRKKREKY